MSGDRRLAARRVLIMVPILERRSPGDRRDGERRSEGDRRQADRRVLSDRRTPRPFEMPVLR